MYRVRRQRYWSLAPALIWLLAQWALPFALAAPASAEPAAGGIPVSTIVICTPAGTETIQVPAEAPDDGAPLPAPAEKGCGWCQSFGAVAVPPPADAPPGQRPRAEAAPFGGADLIRRPGLAATGFLSRAPPA